VLILYFCSHCQNALFNELRFRTCYPYVSPSLVPYNEKRKGYEFGSYRTPKVGSLSLSTFDRGRAGKQTINLWRGASVLTVCSGQNTLHFLRQGVPCLLGHRGHRSSAQSNRGSKSVVIRGAFLIAGLFVKLAHLQGATISFPYRCACRERTFELLLGGMSQYRRRPRLKSRLNEISVRDTHSQARGQLRSPEWQRR